VVVYPGIAIDCYGRTIVLRAKTPILLSNLNHLGPPDAPVTPPSADKAILFGIRHGEKGVEPVPVLYDERGCGQRVTNNRIDEVPTFCWNDDDTTGKCWQVRQPDKPCEPFPPAGECLTPACPCGAMVPLALVAKSTAKPATWQITKERLSFDGVRYLPGPLAPQMLTHICEINWKHGKKMSCEDLEHKPPQPAPPATASAPAAQHPTGEHHHHHHKPLYLSLKFDRQLMKPIEHDASHAVGLNPHTFLVQYTEGLHGARKDLPGKITVEEEAVSGCERGVSRATFTLDPAECAVKEMLEATEHRHVFVYVTLKGDFIQDYRGRAVDGDFLCGSLPTGNGVEGGTFESWFQLTHAHHAHHGQHGGQQA
jgi:hypothetical protein